MVTIEQVKQLESRVSRVIEHVNKVTDENTLLKGKLDAYQKRIDELEVLIERFKSDQNRIEEGIVSALDRLNKFEDDVERSGAKQKPVPVSPKEIEKPADLPVEGLPKDDHPEEAHSELDIF
ncbi:MAG: hypothetical protein Ta2F_09110 [Termitinemataceae bacterium]|nr:MAG: hypothetical protein Ta2F_09110 [Termitinemataceae bacterium]